MDDQWWPCEDLLHGVTLFDPIAEEQAYNVSLQSVPTEPPYVNWQAMSVGTQLQTFDIYTDGNYHHRDHLNEIRHIYQAAFPQIEMLPRYTVADFEAKILASTHHRLSKITRVQNRSLFEKYQLVRRDLQNEKPIFAFHATDVTAAFSIIAEGFDVRRAKRKKLGYGTYFSRNMLPTLRYASGDYQSNGNVKMHVLMCDAVLGPTATGHENQIDFGTTLGGQRVMTLVPPQYNPRPWFVVRDPAQALPLYILEVEYVAAFTLAHSKKQEEYCLGRMNSSVWSVITAQRQIASIVTAAPCSVATAHVSSDGARKRLAATRCKDACKSHTLVPNLNVSTVTVALYPPVIGIVTKAPVEPSVEKVFDSSVCQRPTKRPKTSVCTTIDVPEYLDDSEAMPSGFADRTYAHIRWTLFGYDFTRWQRVRMAKPTADFHWAAKKRGTIHFIINKTLYFVKLDNDDLTQRVRNVNVNNMLNASIVDYIKCTSDQIEAI